jgi:hypothetical protein
MNSGYDVIVFGPDQSAMTFTRSILYLLDWSCRLILPRRISPGLADHPVLVRDRAIARPNLA